MTPAGLEREGPLAVVTFDSPPLNLYDRAMGEALETAIAELEREPPRGLLFRARGRVVSGGVDVNLFQERVDAGGDSEQTFGDLLSVGRRVEAFPFPTVFAAHALCLTWAFELALACDVLLAAEAAGFGLVERRVGLTPGAGGTQRVAERAGPARARELVYTGDIFPAATLEAGTWSTASCRTRASTTRRSPSRATSPTARRARTRRPRRSSAPSAKAASSEADRVTASTAGDLFATEDLRGAVASFLAEGPGKARFEGR